MKKKIFAGLLAAAMMSIVGCGGGAAAEPAEASAADTAAAGEADGGEAAEEESDLKFVYISKQLTHQWFAQEEMGIQEACEELGIEYVGIDSNNNDEKCLQDIDSALAMNADAILICITNQSMGPNLAARCAEEGVALITIDDNIVDGEGNPVPHVGMPTKEVGTLGGEELAAMANERGFFEEGNVVKVLQIHVPTNTVFAPRLEGYKEALMENTPLTEEDFIQIDSEDATGSYEGNLSVSSAAILAHPEVTHWIITGANDDCALAPMDILEEQGFSMDNVLSCGLGGYEMSLEEFKNGNESYIAIVLQPDVEGYLAVYEAYNYLVNGEPMEENTYVSGSIANCENYLEYYPNGKLVTDQ